MSDYKPLAVDLSTKEASPEKFAADAAAVLKDMDRVEIEPSAAGLVLRAVWELDADIAVYKLQEALDLHFECGNPRILYREEDRVLEPIMQISVSVPVDCVGEVTGDLNWRRCLIQEVTGDDDNACTIEGLVPLANMFGYLNTLRQMTRGEGKIHADFHGYEPIPPYEPDPDPSQPSAAALRARRTA